MSVPAVIRAVSTWTLWDEICDSDCGGRGRAALPSVVRGPLAMLYNAIVAARARGFAIPFFSQSGDRNVAALFDRFIGALPREKPFFSRFPSRDN